MINDDDRVALVLMAKAPRPGTTKTRLSPPLSANDAAELYRCMLLDKIGQVARMEYPDFWIAYASAEDEPFFRVNAPQHVSLLLQQGRDLGDRMQNIVAEVLRTAHGGVVLTGTDLPMVDNSILIQAIQCVREKTSDVVVGPTADGGYYLIGLTEPAPWIFAGVAWSTNLVLGQTLDNARHAGRTVAVLEEKYDIDDFADLRRLATDLEANRTLAPRTFAHIKSLGLF